MDHKKQNEEKEEKQHKKSMYKKFGLILLCSFVAMYVVMYTLVASWGHIYFSLNMFYMTTMSVSAMGIVMLVGMRKMFKNKKRNYILYGIFGVLIVLTFIFEREQTFITDEVFLRSMIPHHSKAVLICREASIINPKIEKLCDGIIQTQLQEIRRMKEIMDEY